MDKDFIFFRGYLDRDQVGEEEPCLLASTEVVQAVCDAGFQNNGFCMRSFSSSPHCYYNYAKESQLDFDELLIEKNRYGAIWLHFAVRPANNRRKILFINA